MSTAISLVRDNMAPLMFAGMILFMLIGFPAAFSLAATGLFFGFIAIQFGLNATLASGAAAYLLALALTATLRPVSKVA